MDDIHALLGKTVKGKVCRYGWPIMTGRVVNVGNATYGNIRVQFEDRSQALMVLPHHEIVT